MVSAENGIFAKSEKNAPFARYICNDLKMLACMFQKNPVLIVAMLSLTQGFAATAYINQIGYRTSDVKEMTLFEGAGDVEFLDESGDVVFTATPMSSSSWGPSGQNVQRVDFSGLDVPGIYSVKVGGAILRTDLKIADNTYEDLVKASLKFFYYQRASMALEEKYAGQWKRSAGHEDNQVHLHSSTGASGIISSSKGWYDAGDYGKYIVNSGISTYTLLSLYEHFPAYFDQLEWNIPNEGNLPDLLEEIKYNLDWMLTMQVGDGGVYHKLTTLNFSGFVMPEEDNAIRYAIGKGTAATLDFAAVMATAARVYKKFDAGYAEKCLKAAKSAYAWGLANPSVRFSNPTDVKTGEYGDGSFNDEKQFAASELFITTGDEQYKLSGAFNSLPSWANVSGLATYGKATHVTEFGSFGDAAKDSLLKMADDYVDRANSGFGVVMGKGDFVWGSNSVAANQGIWLLHAYYISGDEKYYKAAVMVLDYLMGKNPLNMSFVTGMGTKSPKHPHHRPSEADGIAAPVPGMLVGGPQPNAEDKADCVDYRTGYAATTYLDDVCSYASNEVAINWNAPMAYLAGALEALNHGHNPSFSDKSIAKTTALGRSVKTGSISTSNFPRLRFRDQMLYVEKNGIRYNLKGHRLK